MAEKKEEKLKKLENVRAKFPDKANDVKYAVSNIEENVFKDPEKRIIYADKLFDLFYKNRSKYAEIAGCFGCSRTTIQRLMSSNSEAKKYEKIDKYYLEMFSLFYDVSPLYLVGKVKEPGNYDAFVEAMSFTNEEIVDKIRTVIVNLIDSDIRAELLFDFIKIATAKYDMLGKFELLLKAISVMDFPNAKFNKEKNYDWFSFIRGGSEVRRQNIFACNQILERLSIVNNEVFESFVSISYFDDVHITAIHKFLNDAELFANGKHFDKNVEIKRKNGEREVLINNEGYSFELKKKYKPGNMEYIPNVFSAEEESKEAQENSPEPCKTSSN